MRSLVLASAMALAACSSGSSPAALSISPATVTVEAGQSTAFRAAGGSAPYVFSVAAGGGTITAAGSYTAPAAAGSATVRVTDHAGATADAAVTVTAAAPALGIAPGSAIVDAGGMVTFAAHGGKPPYSFSVTAGGGAVDASSGAYRAPAAAGSAKVRVSDSAGKSADANVTINPALGISPPARTVATGARFTFQAQGGTSPFTFTLASGAGAVGASTGVYVAPPAPGSAAVRVTDATGATADAAVTVEIGTLAISPAAITYPLHQPVPAFTTTGGTPPVHYAVVSGAGTIDPDSGVFTPAGVGTATVQATDDAGATSVATVSITAAGVDGTVFALLHAGSSWYAGGNFTALDPFSAPNLIVTHLDGAPTGCDLGSGFDGNVTAVAQSGSSIYVGGSFTHYRGQPANRLARLDAATCGLDTVFNPPDAAGFTATGLIAASISSLAVSGTSLYVAGRFTRYNGQSANNLAKLDLSSGALDTTFSPASNGFDFFAAALAVAGNSLYVGGPFTRYRGAPAASIAKLDLASGNLDTTFSPAANNGFDGGVDALAVSGGSLYVGGLFSSYRGVANSANGLAKLDLTTGDIDTTFSPPGSATSNGFDGSVESLAASAGSLYVGGTFTAYRDQASGSLQNFAKLDLASGALDAAFTPAGANGFDADVQTIVFAGGSLFVGGAFATYRGAPAAAVVKLDPATGQADSTFVPPANSRPGVGPAGAVVNVLSVLGDSVVIGGSFANYGGYLAHNLAKLDDATLAPDLAFSPPEANGFDGTVRALAVSGSALYVGGAFTRYKGVANSANAIAKLDAITGTIDTAFSPVSADDANANGFAGTGTCADIAGVAALAVSDTAIYAGGCFTDYRGVANGANGLARLDLATGAIDTVFSPVDAANPAANGVSNEFGTATVKVLAVVGTSLYVGGAFTAYRGVADSADALVKLDLQTGAPDTTFSPVGANGFSDAGAGSSAIVNALAVSGQSLYVGGFFDAYTPGAAPANNLAKLDLVSAAFDATFSPPDASGFDGPVEALAVVGTSLYVGGIFTTYLPGTAPANDVTRLDLASGAIDTTFSPAEGPNGTNTDGNSQVAAIAVSGGKLLLGGGFQLYRDVPAPGLTFVDPVSGAPAN